MTKNLLAALVFATISLSFAQAAVNPASVANPVFTNRLAPPPANVAVDDTAPHAAEKPASGTAEDTGR